MKKNTILKDALILTVITLIAGGLLGLVYEVTKSPLPISRRKRNRKHIRQCLKTQTLLRCVWKQKMQIWQKL